MKVQDLKKANLPDAPGVYFFLRKRGPARNERKKTRKKEDILYIGRAASLKNRVRSYFDPDIPETRGAHIQNMIAQAKAVDFQTTDSVLEALLLEANLIKKYHPPFNTKEKDDKSFNYVIITDEDFPRVLLVRGKELFNPRHKPDYEIKYSFGPFPKGAVLKDALKIVRKIFPFRDRCIPCVLKSDFNTQCKPCFNRQVGLCPGVCTGEISKAEYRKQIRNIKLLFEGKKGQAVKQLTREMKEAARQLEFEKAEDIKRTIFALEHIQDVALIKDEGLRVHRGFRVEGYDIAHTSGTNVVGVMTVAENGAPETGEYRKFKIKSFEGINDVKALAEVLTRRLDHPEWQLPKLIVIDGGKAQKNAAERVLREAGVAIPAVAVVKDEHHKPKKVLGRKDLVTRHEKDIVLANAEAHRFAVRYHRQLRDKTKGSSSK